MSTSDKDRHSDELIIGAMEKEKTVYLIGTIDANSLHLFDSMIDVTLEKSSGLSPNTPLKIVISSPGGVFVAATAMFDTLREVSKKGVAVWTIVKGMAASSALFLAQAGDRRLIYPRAAIGFHSVHFMDELLSHKSSRGSNVTDVRQNKKYFEALENELKVLNKIYYTVLHERSGISYAKVAKLCESTVTLSAQSALKLGLFDEVVDLSS